MFLNLRKDADKKRLFCSNVSTLLSMIVGPVTGTACFITCAQMWIGCTNSKTQKVVCGKWKCIIRFQFMTPVKKNPLLEVSISFTSYLYQVKDEIATDDFKPNCALVVLDFLIRNGFVSPDNGKYINYSFLTVWENLTSLVTIDCVCFYYRLFIITVYLFWKICVSVGNRLRFYNRPLEIIGLTQPIDHWWIIFASIARTLNGIRLNMIMFNIKIGVDNCFNHSNLPNLVKSQVSPNQLTC